MTKTCPPAWLVLEDVSFAYQERAARRDDTQAPAPPDADPEAPPAAEQSTRFALRHVSLDVPPGQTGALVGATVWMAAIALNFAS